MFIVLWFVSVIFGALVLPIVSLLWVSKVLRRLRRAVLSAAILMWLVSWIMTIVASEASLITYAYKNRLGFGQIMTLVMLFLQVWDIGSYPFQKTDHGDTRIMYWWRTTGKPTYLQVRRFLKKGKITTSYCKSNVKTPNTTIRPSVRRPDAYARLVKLMEISLKATRNLTLAILRKEMRRSVWLRLKRRR